jgi:hypothetical protein
VYTAVYGIAPLVKQAVYTFAAFQQELQLIRAKLASHKGGITREPVTSLAGDPKAFPA